MQSVHAWLKANRLKLVEERTEHFCPINGAAGNAPTNITLTIRVVPLRRGSTAEPGIIHMRRQQMDNNLGDVIEKALKKKLPKLVNTPADKRMLLLERQYMDLLPEMMLAEIDRRRAAFPELEKVDEIWIIETIFYGTAFGGTYLRFELYEKGHVVQSYRR